MSPTRIRTQEQAAAVIVKTLTKALNKLAVKNNNGFGKQTHICIAICCTNMGEYSQEITQQYIMRALNTDNSFQYHYTFNEWVKRNYGVRVYNSMSYDQIQALRHRWVKKIIRNLTKKYLT